MTPLVVMLLLCAAPPLPVAAVAAPASSVAGAHTVDGPPRESVPTPDRPGDIPVPPGYAPRDPQPFLSFPQVALAQYVAALGVGGVLGWASWIPVVGLVLMLVTPGAQALSAVYAGDRLGPWRSALFWPVIAAYAVSWLGLGAAVGVQLVGQVLLAGGSVVGMVALAAGGPVGVALAVGGLGAGAVGMVLVILGSVATLLVQYVGVPASIVAAYHVARVGKRPDDSGDGFPRILPGKGFRLPFIGPRGEDAPDDDQEDRPTTPVVAPVQVLP